MIRLDKALSAWGTPDFEATLKREIEHLDPRQLPLQQGLSVGSHALEEPVRATLLHVADMETLIRVKAGVFFSSMIAGCSCADDPTPVDKLTEYCVVQLDIDKSTAATTISLVAE